MWLNEFLLAQWLWGMTWGFYHIPIAIIAMIFLTKMLIRYSYLQAAMLSLFVNFGSVAAYTLLVITIIKFIEGPEYELRSQAFGVVSPLQASLMLGLIYLFFNLIFMYLLTLIFRLSFWRLATIALISNSVSALTVYAIQPLLV